MTPTEPHLDPPALERLQLAQRVADAHRGIDDASLLSFVSGSTVDNLCDARSDVDMSVVFERLPAESTLREACRRAGGEWTWTQGSVEDGLVVAFRIDDIEVQIGYSSRAQLHADIDDLVVHHNPDTPNHKLAEGIVKARPLAGVERFEAMRARLAAFPRELGRAMVRHGLGTPVPWRAANQLPHRDAGLWCREIQVDACYRLLLVLCGLNGRYFTRFQVKRMGRLADRLTLAPPALAARIEAVLAVPPRFAFDELHRLEEETLALVEEHLPEVDVSVARQRAAAYAPAWR